MKEIVFNPSTIENIDFAIFEWIDDGLNLFTDSNDGWRKVPVIFSSPERSWMSKAYKELHDNMHSLRYPIIAVSRKNIGRPKDKSATLRGTYFGNTELSGSLVIHKQLNHEKTSQRANLDSLRTTGMINFPRKKTTRPVYNLYKIPFPTFVVMNYEISIISNFQEEMNELISPFLKFAKNTHGFKITRNGHAYEVFMGEEFNNSSNVEEMNEEERRIEYTFSIKTYAYIMHGESNDRGPTVKIVETRPELKIKQEFVFTGDLDDL